MENQSIKIVISIIALALSFSVGAQQVALLPDQEVGNTVREQHYTIKQVRVPYQTGVDCAYHALRNGNLIARALQRPASMNDVFNELNSEEQINNLLGAQGRWRQEIIRFRTEREARRRVKDELRQQAGHYDVSARHENSQNGDWLDREELHHLLQLERNRGNRTSIALYSFDDPDLFDITDEDKRNIMKGYVRETYDQFIAASGLREDAFGSHVPGFDQLYRYARIQNDFDFLDEKFEPMRRAIAAGENFVGVVIVYLDGKRVKPWTSQVWEWLFGKKKLTLAEQSARAVEAGSNRHWITLVVRASDGGREYILADSLGYARHSNSTVQRVIGFLEGSIPQNPQLQQIAAQVNAVRNQYQMVVTNDSGVITPKRVLALAGLALSSWGIYAIAQKYQKQRATRKKPTEKPRTGWLIGVKNEKETEAQSHREDGDRPEVTEPISGEGR